MADVAVARGARDRGGTAARSRSRQMLAMMIGCGLVFLLIGLGLVVNASLSVSTQAQLRADGQTTIADVVDAYGQLRRLAFAHAGIIRTIVRFGNICRARR